MFKYLAIIFVYCMVSNSMLEYGEFDLKLSKFQTCKGPKRKNCVEIGTKIVNGIAFDMDFNIKEDMRLVKAKIIGSMNGNQLLRLQIRNMCDHTFFKPFIQGLFNNSNRCGFEKGHYRLYVDIQMVARNFYGGKFMYGNWNFNWVFYNEYCNLHCASVSISMTPKESAVGDNQ